MPSDAAIGATGRALPPATWASVVGILVVPFAQFHIVAGVVAVVLGGTGVAAGRRRGAPAAARLGALVVLLGVLLTLAVPFSVWVAVGLVAVASRWLEWLRPAAGWLPSGTSTTASRVAGVVVVLGTAVALTAWVRWTDDFGAGTDQLVDFVGDAPLPLLVVLGIVFVVINAITEEVAYRGLVQDAARAAWRLPTAVAVQAAAFGLLHVAGFPAGVVGATLAGLYGLLLGVLREQTGGLRAPVVVHMAADTTIAILFWLLVLPAAA